MRIGLFQEALGATICPEEAEKVLKTVDQSIECGSVLKSEVLRWTNKSFGSISRKKFKNWGRFHGKSRKFNCFNVSYVLRIGDNSLENCENSKSVK